MPSDYGSVVRFDGSADKKVDDDKHAPRTPATESSDGPEQDSGEHSDGDQSDNDDDDANDGNEGEDEGEHLSRSQKRKQRKRRQLARDEGDGDTTGDAQSFHTASQNTSKDSSKQDGKEKDAPPFTRGPVLHSSQLDALPKHLLAGKRIVIVGSGASAVEAVETVLARTEGAFLPSPSFFPFLCWCICAPVSDADDIMNGRQGPGALHGAGAR